MGTLYVVATPLGNLSELSPRAIEILQSVTLIAAEDTRTSLPLLKRFGIETKLTAYHKFNEEAAARRLTAVLAEGDIALISDAGTPCISDPGYILVSEAVAAGFKVTPICGPSAVTAALSISGFNVLSFAFYGFLPRNKSSLREVFTRLAFEYSPVSVFYESPLRIEASLSALAELMPDSEICLCNDLTKLHERIYRGSPGAVLSELCTNEKARKGEYTLVISRTQTKPENAPTEEYSLEARLVELIVTRSCSLKEAVKALSESGVAKNDAYAASLKLKDLFK